MKKSWILILFILSFKLVAAPKGPTASARWPVVFVPQIFAEGGTTSLDNNNLETAGLGGAFSVYYLKNYLVGGAQGSFHYFTAANRAKNESESFSAMDGTILGGVYFKDGSKILAGWSPFIEMKSTASQSKYRGSGMMGQIHWMVSYPLQVILNLKMNSYDQLISADGTTSELTGDNAIDQMLVSLGVGYEF